jgi:hypothetical protein
LYTKFNTIIKQLEIAEQSKLEYLCSSCGQIKTKSCNNIECNSLQKESIEMYLFDISQQLNELIKREKKTISDYREVNLSLNNWNFYLFKSNII